MELKMQPYKQPEPLIFNYEELKTAILARAAEYETIVYNDDQVKIAKADRANLNRLKKALNDERLRQEKEYMQPFATFKAQINEIIAIIDKPIQVIDAQVKAFEEQQKEEKYAQIEAFWNECEHPAPVKLLQIMDTKWLNASVSMKTIKEEITNRLCQIANDLDVVRKLPAYAFEAEQAYINSLDLAKAVSEAHRLQEMAKLKAEHEAALQEKHVMEPIPMAKKFKIELNEPQREWIAFEAFLSPDEAKALAQYMKDNGIQYRAVG